MLEFYIQTVYIPRENIFFIEEWLDYHSKLGVDKFYLYDNSGSLYKDFIGNLEIDGRNKNGWDVKELTKELSDSDITKIEDELFEKYNVTRIKWQPLDKNGDITYNQTESINDFLKYINKGFCAFIDIDEFISINNYNNIKDYIRFNHNNNFDGIKIYQKKFVSRWYNKSSVISIKTSLNINTDKWAPKIIANLERVNNVTGSVHDFLPNLMIGKNIHFNHYNHDYNGHKWLLENYKWLDPKWIPIEFDDIKK